MKLTKNITSLLLAFMILITCFALPVSAAGVVVHGIGFVNATSLRLRSEPNTSAAVIATAYSQECVVVLSKSGEWYKVNYNLQEGYMHEDYLTVATKENAELGYGNINGAGVNLRSGPSTSFGVVTTGSKDSKCYIIGVNNGWYKVIYRDQICYIRSDFVTLTEYPYENRASSNSPKFYRTGRSLGTAPSASALGGNDASVSVTPVGNVTAPSVSGNQILAEAQKHLGAPYVYGGASPSGFDCSGFVYYVLKQVGLSPNRTPDAQYQQGTPVSKDSLQPGDIVFFSGTYGSGITHVGIYAGGGKFIHAPNSRSTVSYSDLTSGYWANHYHGARRMS